MTRFYVAAILSCRLLDAYAGDVQAIAYATPTAVLTFNGEQLHASAYEGEAENDKPYGLGSFRLVGSKLFDEIRGNSVSGRLDGLVTIYVSPGLANAHYRPAMLCDAGFRNCREAPPPRDVYFRGQAVAGKLVGPMVFYAHGKYVGDLWIDAVTGKVTAANIYLYHQDSSRIPTRRFVGAISSDWELKGEWLNVPWSRELIDSHFVSVNGNNGIFWKAGTKFMWSGDYGRSLEVPAGVRLLSPHVHPTELPKQPQSLDRDSYTDLRYGATVAAAGSLPDDDVGRFHGLIDARTPDGIVYRAPYSVKKALLVGPATVWSGDRTYQGSTDGESLTWVSESKFHRKVDRLFRGIICPIGGKSPNDKNCNINIAFNVNSEGRVRLANDPGYEPCLTEYEAIKSIRPQDLLRINNSFDAAVGTVPANVGNLGVAYMLEAKLYSALASQDYSGAASARDFERKLVADLGALASLADKATFAPERLFAESALQNERLVNQVNIYRAPAGLIDIFGNLVGFWATMRASSQILDVKLRIDSYRDGAGNMEQKLLIDRASRQVEKIGIDYLNNFAAQSAIQLNAAMVTAIFAKVPDLGKLSQRDQIKVLNDLRIDAENFYDKNRGLTSAGDFAIAVAQEVESRLLEDLLKRGKFDFPSPM